jgi:hypothetical protein
MAQILTAVAAGFDADGLRLFLLDGWGALRAWVIDGYEKAPALMAGLAALALVPPLAIAGYLYHRVATARRRARPQPEPIHTIAASAMGLGWPHEAWITIDGVAPVRRAVPREMLSFGREEDNDIRLDDASVHRHHAVLHRTPESHFIIRDLSGNGGNGVKVNGARVNQKALADGDRIELGKVVILFEARPA